MKALKTVLILSLLTYLSCEKTDSCKNCIVKIESNEKEARYKCQGLANSYPSVYETVHEYTQAFCEPYPRNTSINKSMCSGVNATIRTTYNCR